MYKGLLFLLVIGCSYATVTTKINKPELLWTTDRSADDRYIAAGGDDSLLHIYDSKNWQFKDYPINSMIRQVKWHPLKNILAIATRDDRVSIFNPAENSFIPLKGIKSGARGIGWNYTGELLATADNDGLVKIWDAKGKLLRIIKKENSNSYFSLDWHPSKNILVVSGDNIRIIDTAGITLRVIKNREENTGILTVRWHPSGDFFVGGDYGHDAEGIPSLLQFWKPDGTLIKSIKGSKAEYRNLAWSKDGELLATASDALRIWDAAGRLLYTGKSNDVLWGVNWNNAATEIITASYTGQIFLWDAKARVIKELNK